MAAKQRRKGGGYGRRHRNNPNTDDRLKINNTGNISRKLKSEDETSANFNSDDNNTTVVDLCGSRRDGCRGTQQQCIRNTDGSSRCFCTYVGRFLQRDEECVLLKPPDDRNDGVLSPNDLASVNPPTLTTSLTEWTSGRFGLTNTTESSVTNSSAAAPVAGGHSPMSMTLTVTLSTFIFPLFVLLLVCYLRRRYKKRYQQEASGNFNFWCDCLWHRPKNHLGLQALGKTSVLDNQQFTANPNYYSAPPEMAILKSLMHLEIAGDRLAFLDIIGEGCFGKVFKGAFRKNEAEVCDVAIKILKENSTSEIQVDFLREVEIMSSFDHENILALLGVVVVENGATPWMVFEFMEYGDLAELLRENTPYFWTTPNTACKITKNDLPWLATQVASGMTYLSSQHFVHRDLATRNCLVGKGPMIKISDFGMSRDIYTCDYYKIGGSRMLPVRWMAPESVMYGKFTLETDVWSFGVVLWEIFAYGKQPYYGHSNEEVVKLIRQGILLSPPEDCPHYVCQLMEMCWRTNPYDRIKFSQIYEILLSRCSPERKPVALTSAVPVPAMSDASHPEEIINNRCETMREMPNDLSSNYLVPRALNSFVE